MDSRSLLHAFDVLLRDRTMGDDVINNHEVVVANTIIINGILYISVEANDGTIKRFRLAEV